MGFHAKNGNGFVFLVSKVILKQHYSSGFHECI